MKKVLFIFTVYSLSLSLVLAQESKYRIDGKSYNKQIYDDNNNQITEFENWEYIKDFYISPNNKKMLVYHKPDKAKAYLMSLYDLESRSLTAECEPGWACVAQNAWAKKNNADPSDYPHIPKYFE